MRQLLLCTLLVLGSACGGAAAPVADAHTEGAHAKAAPVDGPTAKALVAKGAVLVDVRSKEEFDAGHVDGAINVPVDTVASHDFGKKDAPLVVYCGSGARSARAATALVGQGYTAVHDLGAMSNWSK